MLPAEIAIIVMFLVGFAGGAIWGLGVGWCANYHWRRGRTTWTWLSSLRDK